MASTEVILSGRAVVVNALALSRIWYVASLIPTPVWVLASLNRLIFPFFWGGKVDLVARDVVIQPPDFGGFSLVSVQVKVWALHVQWVGRFVRRFSAWMQFLFYYARVLYGSTPGDLVLPATCRLKFPASLLSGGLVCLGRRGWRFLCSC